jgi:hypothetical protein
MRSRPEYADRHEIHVIIDRYAAYPCDNMRALADELGTYLDFIPPELPDNLQSLG